MSPNLDLDTVIETFDLERFGLVPFVEAELALAVAERLQASHHQQQVQVLHAHLLLLVDAHARRQMVLTNLHNVLFHTLKSHTNTPKLNVQYNLVFLFQIERQLPFAWMARVCSRSWPGWSSTCACW